MGALEEEDEDIYSQESLSSYTHTLSSDKELSSSLKFGWTGSSSGCLCYSKLNVIGL